MSSRPIRPFRTGEREARKRALDLARVCIASNLSAQSVAEKNGVPRGSIAFAVLILKKGTPEDIAELESLDVSVAEIYHRVTARLSPEEIKELRAAALARPRPEQYLEQRFKALAAAEDVRDHGLSYIDAGLKHGLTRSTVGDAYTVLIRGTPEQLERLRSGSVALRVIHREILAASKGTKVVKKQIVRSVGSKDQDAMDIVIWERLRAALSNLRDLPTPADVVAVARKNSRRRATTDEMLMSSFTWITEFADAWTK